MAMKETNEADGFVVESFKKWENSGRSKPGLQQLAYDIGVKQYLMRAYPPDSINDMMEKMSNEYTCVYAGSDVIHILAKVIISTTRAKFGKTMTRDSLLPALKMYGTVVDPFFAVRLWNNRKGGVPLPPEDFDSGFHMQISLHHTEDFEVALDIINQLSKAQVTTVVTAVMKGQVVGLRTSEACRVEGGAIQALDEDAEWVTIDENVFCELLVLDPLVIHPEDLLVEGSYVNLMAEVKAQCNCHVLLVGNPGTGKSTLINCHLQELIFTSGLSSNGQGVTFKLDRAVHRGKVYMDTPGLSDLKLRQQAATAISDALQHGGNFQLLFVMTTEDGRTRTDDITTMKLVLEATHEQIKEDGFGILINKVGKKTMKKLDKGAFVRGFQENLMERHIPTTKHMHFALRVEDLDEEDNAVVPLDPEVNDFIRCLPTLNIEKEMVSDVDWRRYEDLVNAIAQAEGEKKELEREAKAAKEKAEQAELANVKAKQEAEKVKTAREAERLAKENEQLSREEKDRANALKVEAERDAEAARTDAERQRKLAAEHKVKADREVKAARADVERARQNAENQRQETERREQKLKADVEKKRQEAEKQLKDQRKIMEQN